MAIRRVTNVGRFKPFAWIPPVSSAVYKIEVIRDDGTVDDITDEVVSYEFENGVTDAVGGFVFEIFDSSLIYTKAWNGGETVFLYIDYGSTATTKRFKGLIEKPSKKGFKLTVTGRINSSRLSEVTVTKSFSNVETSVIFKSLISTYAPGFTDTNVEVSSVSVTVNWFQKPFFECVKELAKAAGFDYYGDPDDDFHYFLVGSRQNTGEVFLHDSNIFEIIDFAPDRAQVRNRIIVYGARDGGTQILYTSKDLPSQSEFGIREEIVNDKNVVDFTQAKELADFILAEKKDPPVVGEIQGTMLATIEPGEQIRISAPEADIQPAYYDIISFKHILSEKRGPSTVVFVNKEPRKTSRVISDIISQANKTKDTTVNPEEMRFAYNFTYATDTGTHVDTEITQGVLKLQDAESPSANAIWTSPTRDLPTAIDEARLVLDGSKITDVVFQVSGNEGLNYQAITNGEKITMGAAKGKKLILRAIFSGTNADQSQIDSASLQYTLD